VLAVSIRSDYLNGTERSPLPFREELFVLPELRGKRIARHLVRVAEA
jgi:GNAT superfamily N-acetyltransferase